MFRRRNAANVWVILGTIDQAPPLAYTYYTASEDYPGDYKSTVHLPVRTFRNWRPCACYQ